MALIMNYTVGGVTTDISRYVDWSTVQIQEQINIPTQLTFDAYNYDNLFPNPPTQRAYLQIYSTYYKRSLFTGYLSSQPNAVYQGLKQGGGELWEYRFRGGGQLFKYEFICTSDEHLLNCKAVPFIPAFVGQTQGQILSALANILCPGMYDTTWVGSGDIEPYYNYSPNNSWCEIAKDFADGSRYRYKVRDKQIWFQPYGDGPLGISYDETRGESTFDPSSQGMQTQVLAVPVVNDVTIIGDVEAGNSREDYFIGDGFTGNFPLRHKVFRGSSTLLLTDDWTESDFNTQQWTVNDPAAQFNLGAGALNIVANIPQQLGQSYIQLNNGLELAGGIDLEHGEFGFNDVSEGIVGGIYTQSLYGNQTYTSGNCLGGFYISTPSSGVVTSASGAAGVVIQPTWGGIPVGPPVVTEVNHNYVLQTVVTAPQYVRYNRWYRSLGGNSYGGVQTSTSGDVTFVIQDFNIAAATGFFYLPNITKTTINVASLPAFAVYALINNQQLNVTVNYTTLATMPLGSLSAYEGPSGLWQPTGLILPMLPPNNGSVGPYGGYIGPVPPWPSDASGNIYPPPLPLGTVSHQEVLGNGFELQAAQVTQGNSVDTLSFYAQSLPAAGTPVRFLSYESQAALSRLQASGSIVEEAFVVGDDGVRSAIVSNLSPLPRTSEDCDAAAQAFLDDRTGVFYNGTYTCTSFFLNQLSSDDQFWPTCGRYLYLNCPARGIDRQQMLVTQLTITVLDPVGSAASIMVPPGQAVGEVGEVLKFNIGFGADLHLEKVLYNFVDIQPPGVLSSKDTAEAINPLYTTQIDNAYQPDISSIMVHPITDTAAQVTVYDEMVAPIEIRRVDGNWGQGPTSDYISTSASPTFTLERLQYEQIWYMRFVDTTSGTYSRRSKVVRIVYPVTPLPPTLIAADSNFVQLDFNGDIRNVYGVEVRVPNVTDVYPILSVGSSVGWDNTANVFSTSGGVYASCPGYIDDVMSVNIPPLPDASSIVGISISGVALTADSQGAIEISLGPDTRYAFIGPQPQQFTVGDQSTLWGLTPAELAAGTSILISPDTMPTQPMYVNSLVMTVYYVNSYTPIVQKPVESYGDLNIDLTKTVNTFPFSSNRTLLAYFFNHQWSYSEPVAITIPAPILLFAEEGYRFGQSLDVMCTLPQRNDIVSQTWQVFSDPSLSATSMIVNRTTNYAGSLTVNVPASSSLWVRSSLSDYVGSGGWYPSDYGLYVPLGDLIASDYLAAQGSVPPILTQGGEGGEGYQTYDEPGNVSAATEAYNNNPYGYVENSNYSSVISGWSSVPYGAGSTLTATISAIISVDGEGGGTGGGYANFELSVDGGSTWSTPWTLSASQSPQQVQTTFASPGNLADVQIRIYALAHASAVPPGGWVDVRVQANIQGISVTDNLGSTGALVSYHSTYDSITVTTIPFTLLYPNKQLVAVPESSGYYTTAKDTGSGLMSGTKYDFYVSLSSLAYPNPTVYIDGPYSNTSQAALAFSVSDGRLPLNAGALLFSTATGGATGYGAGGGTYGAGNDAVGSQYCGVLSSQVKMADGSVKLLRDTCIGDLVDNGVGGAETIVGRQIICGEKIYTVRAGPYTSRVAGGHTLQTESGWANVVELRARLLHDEAWLAVATEIGTLPLTEIADEESEPVCHLQLSGPAHTYVLDGLKTHNTLVKTA